MILPIDESESAEDTAPLQIAQQTAGFFAPGGALERGCAGSPFPYERRPQQERMAVSVAEALEGCTHLAVEAGTGVGKSFAYLVPMILAALGRRTKVAVSTYTISLQEQLVRKDLPFLREHMGVEFRAVLVKGKGNYVCLRRLARAERMGGDLFHPGEMGWLARIRAWAAHTADGSIQDMPEEPPASVWSSVSVEEGNCLGQKCPEFRRCLFMKARRAALDADVLVVNHHLLFSDLALRMNEAALLPPYDALVVDEAHQMEDVASEHLGLRLSHYMFEHWMRRVFHPDTGKGLLAIVRDAEAAHLVTRLWEEVARLFADLRHWAKFDENGSPRPVGTPLAIETGVAARLGEIVARLGKLAKDLEDPDLRGEVRQAAKRGVEMRAGLQAFLKQSLEDQVYWLECEGRRRQVVMYSAPVEVAPLLKEFLFDALPCVIMTSATLAVNGSLDFFLKRVGAEECRGERVGSPFDYGRQMRVLLPRRMPDPNEERFLPAAASAVLHFVARTAGAAFVLFTSAAMMRRIAALVRGPLSARGLNLLVQGEGTPRHTMLERFRAAEGSVLFGLDSFWMGVDVPGDALQNVIIMRLPFAVPDHPLVQARMQRIQVRGGDAFREYSLPLAVIKFRQGVGRLIRTAADTGIVVVLDRRIAEKWYGRWFLGSIPECPVEVVEVPGPLEETGPAAGEAG